MFKIIFILLILFSIEAKIQNKPDLKKNHKKGNEKKLDCSAFLKGNFESYDENGVLDGRVYNDGKYSYFETLNSDTKVFSELIYSKDSNCIYTFKKLEVQSSTLSESKKNKIKNFSNTEEIYKIDNDIAYYRGVNCNCNGSLKKIN